MTYGPHSHPAFRSPTRVELPVYEAANEFISAAGLIAQTAATVEAPGVHRDALTDELIFVARKWIAREARSREFISELS